MEVIRGERVRLDCITVQDVVPLRILVALPAVSRWWGEVTPGWPRSDVGCAFAIRLGPRVVGFAQYDEEPNPDYRHAWVDLFVDPALHGRGLGRDALLALARHLRDVRGHHRLSVDPAALNRRAIRCFESVNFAPVGVLRAYERDPTTGGWRNALLMDLLTADLPAR